jgi:hypothetical protein
MRGHFKRNDMKTPCHESADIHCGKSVLAETHADHRLNCAICRSRSVLASCSVYTSSSASLFPRSSFGDHPYLTLL